MKPVNNLFCKSDVEFSEDRKYRYFLMREWDHKLPYVNFIMLNPSTADENFNDPTIERCMRRAADWGFGGIAVTNIFAYRATDPVELYQVEDPVGPMNDGWIKAAAEEAGMVICAWGSFIDRFRDHKRERPSEVLKLLAGTKLYYLKQVKSGQPSHPLYVNYSIKPKEWCMSVA